MNVLEAAQQCIAYIFSNFWHVYVVFSDALLHWLRIKSF